MSGATLALVLRYVVGKGWYIIAETADAESEVGGPYRGIEQAIREREHYAKSFDHSCNCGPGDCGHNVVGAA